MEFNVAKHLKECINAASSLKGSKKRAEYLTQSEASAFMGETYSERVRCLIQHGWHVSEATLVADKLGNKDRWKTI